MRRGISRHLILVLAGFIVSVFSMSAGYTADNWDQKSPASKPSARNNHAMAYIGENHVFIDFK